MSSGWHGHRLILFGFLPQSSKTKDGGRGGQCAAGGVAGQDAAASRRGDLVWFRAAFYGCLTARADELFELTEALLCTDGPGPDAGGVGVGARASPRPRRAV